MSQCCGKMAFIADIYLVANNGRKVLGAVRVCSGCQKPLELPRRYKGGSVLTDVAWSKMLEAHPFAPFYFVAGKNGIEPENKVKPEPTSKPIAKKENAYQPEPEEPEPEYGPEE